MIATGNCWTPLLLGLALVACTSPNTMDSASDPPDPTTPPVPDSAGPSETGTPPLTETGAPTDTGLVFDCSTIPLLPLSTAPVNGARGYHDVAFDADDNIVGSDDAAMIKVDSVGAFELFVPNLGTVQQFDYLPNGDLAVAADSDDAIKRITPDGAVTIISSDVGAYGLIVGPDGLIYTANKQDIHRIDPATGQKTVFIDGDGKSPKVLAFNQDNTKLYFGVIGDDVWSVDLDVNLEPIGAPQLLVTGVGGWHDGMGVDVCGNIYVADATERALYRIKEDGSVVHVIVDPDSPDAYGHGLRWGTGKGGWKDTALYQPQPYNDNTVVEVDIGVPSARAFTGEVIGAVPF